MRIALLIIVAMMLFAYTAKAETYLPIARNGTVPSIGIPGGYKQIATVHDGYYMIALCENGNQPKTIDFDGIIAIFCEGE